MTTKCMSLVVVLLGVQVRVQVEVTPAALHHLGPIVDLGED